MKKFIFSLLIISLIFFTGCPDNEKQKSNDSNKVQVEKNEDTIDEKAAEAFMKNYLSYLLKGNIDGMKSFYSESLKSHISDIPFSASSRPVAYKMEIDESSQENTSEGKTKSFKVNIYNCGIDIPYFSDDTYKYVVEKKEGKMAISKIEKVKSTEIFEMNKGLYKREGDKIKGEKILSLSDMPEYISLSNVGFPGQKIPLPKEAFGPCAISPDGKSIIITTKGITKKEGKDTDYYFIGIVSMKENKDEEESLKQNKKDSRQVIKLEEEKGKESKEEMPSNEEGKMQEGEKAEKAIPIIKTLDLYVGSKIKTVCFSPDGKLILTEYINPSRLNRIKMYKSKEGESMDLIIDKQFLPERFSLLSPYFISLKEIVFKVEPGKDATLEEQKFKGEWEFDFQEQKVRQY